MPVKLRPYAAFLAVLFAVSFANAAERPAPPSSDQKPPAEKPVQIMPAGIYPLTPEREQALRPKDSFKECDACPEMVVVTERISTPRSREEREALHDAPPEAESR